ncbi:MULTISPECIES: biopolymer transporter ExbD [Roseibium]|uniref:ExbD/TolR family protein n=1 Tax=Roseibium TaxID=150830 RepID=UPI00094AF616|nr:MULTISPECIES: biopolymer transporter ExbD [Roseibium]MBO6857990.1 biopolymer transporter ExbD [Roseibium sp.]UFI01580.1 biopolymer transporter ExbD [Roseibium aggregatum]
MISIETPLARRKRIPLTPLIDVIFILIMFFLLSSTFGVWRPLEVALGGGAPAGGAEAQSNASVPAVLIVVRSVPGEDLSAVTVNGNELPLAGLAQELNRLAEAGARDAVLLPGKGTDFQQVVRILDEARTSKLTSVRLHLD